MKIKTLFATLLTLALFSAASAQTLDKAKLDQFFDRALCFATEGYMQHVKKHQEIHVA